MLYYESLSVVTILVIQDFNSYLSSAQFFGTHPVLYDPLRYSRRMLVYPTNVYTSRRPAIVQCCSNGKTNLVTRYNRNRLNFYESISYNTERIKPPFEYSDNFAHSDQSSISTKIQLASKQKTLSYSNDIKNRLQLRTPTNTESLTGNNRNESDSNYDQYIYISTTEMVKSENTETYYVSVKPVRVFDESAEEHALEDSSSTNPLTISQSHNKEPELIENLDLVEHYHTTVTPHEVKITNPKSGLESESIHADKNNSKQGNNASTRMESATFTDVPSNNLEQSDDNNTLGKFLYALDDLERKFYLVSN